MAAALEDDLVSWDDVAVDETDYEVPPLLVSDECKKDEKRKRRFSVSAEDSSKKATAFVRKHYKKTDAAIARIEDSVRELFFFKGLDSEQQRLLVDAMFEKRVVIGEEVISQGDRGDYFYVIESGVFEVWKSASSSALAEATLVYTYNGYGCFGELALMYNAPRAATVRSTKAGTLWAVDRDTFRHITVLSTAKKRAKFDSFVQSHALFANMDEASRSMITDTLELFTFKQGQTVLRQGDEARHFHLIREGQATVTLGSGRVVRTLRKGDYFGERAILLNTDRSATVTCASHSLQTVAMDRPSFLRLMTSSAVYEKMRRFMKSYEFDTDGDTIMATDEEVDATSDGSSF